MRTFIFIIPFIILGCSANYIDIESVEQRVNGLSYYKGTDRLVDGQVTRRFKDGRLAEKVNYKSGKQIGSWFTYGYDGEDITHGYGMDLDQQIIDNNKSLNLSNVTLSINVEGNYQYAGMALRDETSNVTFDALLQLRNSIYNLYSKNLEFKDVFIFYKSHQYRFMNSNYTGNISLDTIKTNNGIIINVR